MPGGKHEEETWCEEGQPGEAEIERRMGDLVDLPGHRDVLRLRSQDHQKARRLVESEIAREKRSARADLRTILRNLSLALCHIAYGFIFLWQTAEGLSALSPGRPPFPHRWLPEPAQVRPHSPTPCPAARFPRSTAVPPGRAAAQRRR